MQLQIHHEAHARLLDLVELTAAELRNPDGDPAALAGAALKQGRWLQTQGCTDQALDALLGQLEGLVSSPAPRVLVAAGRLRGRKVLA